MVQIKVKTLTGRKQEFTVELSDFIVTLKQQLQEKEGISIDQIRLIFGGKQLNDNKKFSEYGISAGDTFHMVLALRGGVAGNENGNGNKSENNIQKNN
jgi:hypothetical protein